MQTLQRCARQTALERQDLSHTYLAHHELESDFIITIVITTIIVVAVIIVIIIPIAVVVMMIIIIILIILILILTIVVVIFITIITLLSSLLSLLLCPIQARHIWNHKHSQQGQAHPLHHPRPCSQGQLS